MEIKIIALLIFLCCILSICQTVGGAQNQKEKWREPNAWAKEVEVEISKLSTLNDGFCVCNSEGSEDTISNNQASIFILKKFIGYMFSREKLEYDEHFSLYQREMLFTILPAQLEKLEKLTDPRDLDSVLTEIFGNARTPNKYNHSNGTWTSIFSLIWDILKDLAMLLSYSEVKFIMFVVVFVMMAWFIHRRHNVGIIIVIIGSFLVFGYLITYLECNRELEIKQMLEVIEKSEATIPPKPSWFTNIKYWFYSSEEDDKKSYQREELKKASKLNLNFCRPDHVLLLYINDLFLKQLEFLIEKCTKTLTSIKDAFVFPYNYLAATLLLLLIAYIIKLTFEHILSPRAWVGFFKRTERTPSSRHIQDTPSHHEDRLSGENLKTLLNALKTTNVFVNNSTTPTISCVQEVLEPLESLKQQSDNSCNETNSSKSKSSNSSKSDTSLSKSLGEESHSPQQSSTPNVSIETIASKLETTFDTCDKDDADFIVVSQVKSKVILEDLPEDK